MSADNLALVSDVRAKLAAGWTFTVDGTHLNGVITEDGREHSLAIRCDSEDDAAALLAAAQA